jgi:hypothetical protein
MLYRSPICPELVHRTSTTDVLLTTYANVSELAICARVFVPASHARVKGGILPAIVIFELFRQGAFLAAHTRGSIPTDWHFVANQYDVTLLDSRIDVPRHGFAADLRVDLSITYRNNKPHMATWNFLLSVGEQLIATGVYGGRILSPSQYRALRRGALEEDGLPYSTRSKIEPAPGGFIIGWDLADSFIFRQPSDHVVSMAIMDAVLIAIPITGRPRLRTRISIEFTAFAERTAPIHLSVDPVERQTQFTVAQGGRSLARGWVDTWAASTGSPDAAS